METYTLKEQDWAVFIDEHVTSHISPQTSSACILALVGDLGAGKTTFSKTLLSTLCVKQHVQSPTFSIINSYDIDYRGFTKVFHIDVYRVEDLRELVVLHIENIFNNPQHIVVIEWADKIKQMIPDGALWITFEHDTLETRKVMIDEIKE